MSILLFLWIIFITSVVVGLISLKLIHRQTDEEERRHFYLMNGILEPPEPKCKYSLNFLRRRRE